MKNRILLAFIFFLTVSFSFSQNEMTKQKEKERKTATLNAVDYLNNSLKFTEKQREVCVSAFFEYAKNIIKTEEKAAKVYGEGRKYEKQEERKYINTQAMRFSQKRDESVKKVLKRRQIIEYEKLVLDLHPITLLKLDLKSKKGQKSKK